MNKQVTNESGFNKNLKVVNTEVPFEGWIPLTAIKTEADKQKYNNIGYKIGHTAKEFELEYPSLNTTKIYFCNGIDECYYFDNDDLEILPLFIDEKKCVEDEKKRAAAEGHSLEGYLKEMVGLGYEMIENDKVNYYLTAMRFMVPPRFVAKYLKMIRNRLEPKEWNDMKERVERCSKQLD
ncbi:MAG: hypothetical protein RR313_05700 [Anaerovoracaceae bacterium]